MNTSLNNKIYLSYGNQAKKLVKEILAAVKPEQQLKKSDLIALKPNLINATPAEQGATTDPEIVAGVIEYFQLRGFNNLMIMEGSWVGANTTRAFQVCGYQKLADHYQLPLFNLQQDSYQKIKIADYEMEIASTALKADYIINFPVLKGHCQTKITCALKNMKGCISNREKRKFHQQGLHAPIAYLNKVLKQDLIIVDGIYGDLDFEEGGNPVQMNRILLGNDPVLIDSYAARLLGYQPAEIKYITLAAKLGVGSNRLEQAEVIELNQDHQSTQLRADGKIKNLAAKVKAGSACSACYGSLIHALKRIDQQGKLDQLRKPIKIGQDYQKQQLAGLGIGSCCSKAEKFVPGCPPSAGDILEFLQAELIN